MIPPQRDPTIILIGMLFIGALIMAAFWIVRPFMAAAIWATTIVVVTWPVLKRMQARLWNSRALAITVMMVILLLLFVIPLTLAIGTIVANAGEIALRMRSVATFRMPEAPQWLIALPFFGERLGGAWEEAAAGRAGRPLGTRDALRRQRHRLVRGRGRQCRLPRRCSSC